MNRKPARATVWIHLIAVVGPLASAGIAGAAPPATQARNRNELKFDLLDRRIEPIDRSVAGQEPGLAAWSEAYCLDAYVLMYRATGDVAWLEQAARGFDTLLRLRDDRLGRTDERLGRIRPMWSSRKYTKGKWHAWIVHAGMLTYPMARFALIVRAEPSLEPRFGQKAAAYVAAIEETAREIERSFVAGPGADEGYYYEFDRQAPMPLNAQNAWGRTLVCLSELTGKDVYRARAGALARYFHRRLALAPDGAYVWDYAPPLEPSEPMPVPARGEDISHAAINVDFAVLCCRHDLVFDRRDMARFAATLLQRVVTPDGTVHSRVDGGPPELPPPVAVSRWLPLGYYDPRVVARIASVLDALPVNELANGHKPSALVGLAYLALYERLGERERAPAPASQSRPASRPAGSPGP